MSKCIRCGICCKRQLCSKGRRKDKNKKGNCKYLIINDDKTTSCELVLLGKMPSSKIDLGLGCAMKYNFPKQYEFYSILKEEGIF